MVKPDINGALQDEFIPVLVPKRKRRPKAALLMQVDLEEQAVVKSENEDLNLHVSLCEQRYKELEGRLDAMEQRLIKVEDQLSALKVSTQAGFSDIKVLLEKQNSARTTQMIATFGSIAVAIIGAVGYIMTRT
jgi:hypothetical protein